MSCGTGKTLASCPRSSHPKLNPKLNHKLNPALGLNVVHVLPTVKTRDKTLVSCPRSWNMQCSCPRRTLARTSDTIPKSTCPALRPKRKGLGRSAPFLSSLSSALCVACCRWHMCGKMHSQLPTSRCCMCVAFKASDEQVFTTISIQMETELT